MPDNDQFSLDNQDISHNIKVALLAVMRMRSAQSNLDGALERMCANQKKMVNFNAKLYFWPANKNQQMNNILSQICIYQMMQKSEEFKKTYLSSPEHLK